MDHSAQKIPDSGHTCCPLSKTWWTVADGVVVRKTVNDNPQPAWTGWLKTARPWASESPEETKSHHLFLGKRESTIPPTHKHTAGGAQFCYISHADSGTCLLAYLLACKVSWYFVSFFFPSGNQIDSSVRNLWWPLSKISAECWFKSTIIGV